MKNRCNLLVNVNCDVVRGVGTGIVSYNDIINFNSRLELPFELRCMMEDIANKWPWSPRVWKEPRIIAFTLAELEKASKEKYAQACVQRYQLRIAHVQLTGCDSFCVQLSVVRAGPIDLITLLLFTVLRYLKRVSSHGFTILQKFTRHGRNAVARIRFKSIPA